MNGRPIREKKGDGISPESLQGKVQTVCGLIPPAELGPTLMHEHILCDLTPPGLFPADQPDTEVTLENVWEIRHHWIRHPGNHRLLQEDVALRELAAYREAGGRAIVEVTSKGLSRDPRGLERISRAGRAHIVMGCGDYTEEFVGGEGRGRTAEAVAEEVLDDLLVGAEGTHIRAGIIGEIGCSHPWSEQERIAMEVAVAAQKKTGATISVHPGRHLHAPFEIARFIREAGGRPDRTIMAHVERTLPDLDSLLEFAETGCVVEFDFFGIESSYYPFQDIDLPNDGQRLRWIRSLIEKGHIQRILLSQDICTKTRLRSYGGHGYGHIFENVVPLKRRRGFDDREIEALLVNNPARLFTFRKWD